MKRKVRATAPEPCPKKRQDAKGSSRSLLGQPQVNHMASDGSPGIIPVASLVQGSQAARPISLLSAGGKSLPPDGKAAASQGPLSPAPAASSVAAAASTGSKPVVQPTADPQVLVEQLNKFLNDSGRPDQFRLDPASGGKLIQQINPATGAVVGEFSATEFPALARGVGVSGLLVDRLA